MKLTLVEKREEVKNVTTFIFQPEEQLFWKAGQFMKYHIQDPKPDERRNDRYFTISSAPHEKYISITSKFIPDDGSSFKKDLKAMEPGDVIEAMGPSGQFVIEDPNYQYVFIAGGIGITPFRSIITDLNFRNLPINITLLYANRDQNIVFKTELEETQKNHPEFKIYFFLDPQRIDAQAIKSRVTDLNSPIYYVSGPEPMVEGVEKLLEEIGVPREHIKRDYFPGYTWP